MKIVIYPNYGSIYIPPILQKKLSAKKDFIYNRIELAEILEKLEPTHDEITQEIYNKFTRSSPDDKDNLYYLKDKITPNIVFF